MLSKKDRILGERVYQIGSGIKHLQSNNPEGCFVGFEGTNITGEDKLFVLWRNSIWPLWKLIQLCGRFLEYGIELQIGHAWNVKNIKTKNIQDVEEMDGKPVYGLYICFDHLMLATIIKWQFTLPRNVGELTGRKKVLPGP